MDANSTPSPNDAGSTVEFATGGVSNAQPRVLPVIVQPVIPETTGAIASTAAANIPRPNEGTIRVIDTGGLAELNFNFAPADVRIAALDVDLVMVFADNSKLILPNLALSLLGNSAPKLNFLGRSVQAQDVISAINQVSLAEATPSVHFASAEFLPKKPSGPVTGEHQNATGQDGIGSGDPPLPPQPIVSGGKFDNGNNRQQAKVADFETPPVREVTPGSVTSGTSSSAIANPSVVNTSSKNLEDALKAASFAFDTVVAARLLQTVGVTSSDETGVHQIFGATGQSPADKNSAFDVQTTKELITGSTSSDEIWGDDGAKYPAGYAGRTIEITLPAIGVTASSVTISGVPSNVKILNAHLIGNGVYEMLVDSKTPNTFTMNIAYQVPPDGTETDSSGFYNGSLFTMNFKFDAKNSIGQTGTLTASAQIGVRDVNQESDQVSTDTATGKIIISLSKLPTGNIINAGAGDDTVHAAAGADFIDGNGGHNRVSYDQSNGGVSVDLSTGKGAKNFATGDTYTNIDDVVGSDYNDTLIGDGRDNLLMGGKGDDSLAGGAGSDLLKLDWSSINYKIDGGSNTDTVSFSSSSNATLSGSSFSSLLSNVEYLDFSNTTNTVSVSLGGADIQNILTGSSSLSSNAGVLDLKFEAGDSFTISASSGYSYYTAASGGTLISAGTTYNASSMSSSATHIYVFNSAGTTLLADVFFHL